MSVLSCTLCGIIAVLPLEADFDLDIDLCLSCVGCYFRPCLRATFPKILLTSLTFKDTCLIGGC